MANLFLAEAGVGASAARLGAVEACVYALHQDGGARSCSARVGVEHLLGVGHRRFSFPRPACTVTQPSVRRCGSEAHGGKYIILLREAPPTDARTRRYSPTC